MNAPSSRLIKVPINQKKKSPNLNNVTKFLLGIMCIGPIILSFEWYTSSQIELKPSSFLAAYWSNLEQFAFDTPFDDVLANQTDYCLDSFYRPKGNISRFKRYYNEPLLYPNTSIGIWSDRNGNFYNNKPVKYAMGCSVYKYFCEGEPKPIPCCNKLAFDIWYELDKYFIKYNITFYTFKWGSLLFSIRDGHHQPWEKDIDIGHILPPQNGKNALKQFIKDYNMSTNRQQTHIIDTGTFYKRYHNKYGWPSYDKKYCFINWQYNLRPSWVPLEQDTPNLLYLVGALTLVDVNTDYESDIDPNPLYHYNLSFKNVGFLDKYMIGPVGYDGPNNMKPPRDMYIFPTFHRMMHNCDDYLEWEYGLYPPQIRNNANRMKYLGINPSHASGKNNSYWESFKSKVTNFFNGSASWLNYTEFRKWKKNNTDKVRDYLCD